MYSEIQKKLVVRLFIALIIAFVFGYLVSEASFQLIKENSKQDVETFEIIIPEGTSERVEKGSPIPSIPDSMIFLEGDSIIVKNEDSTSHQLGPIWVPSGSTGTLTLEKPQTYSMACTFQPSKLMGLEVRPRLTNNIRFQGILAIGFPTGVLGWLFSIVIFPIDSKKIKARDTDV